MPKILLSILLATTAFAAFTFSQASVTEPVLVKLPKTVNPRDGYPSGGTVQVRVNINEQGEVTDAEFVSGPGPVCVSVSRADILKTREAAIAIARRAKFAPATSASTTVASTTIMSIEFAASGSGSRENKKGDKIYVAANQPPTPTGDATKGDPLPKDEAKADPPGTKYTIKGDINFSAANAPPPANDTGAYAGRTISGGVLNGRAIALPKPRYPAAARAVRASGAVQVQVLIDEDGNIFSATAVGGHPLLESASVTAACSSKFSPTLIAGQPVKVSGIITYNFVP